jgi:hypothetical protein
MRQFEENMKEIREKGPLSSDEMVFMRRFGNAVHRTKNPLFG